MQTAAHTLLATRNVCTLCTPQLIHCLLHTQLSTVCACACAVCARLAIYTAMMHGICAGYADRSSYTACHAECVHVMHTAAHTLLAAYTAQYGVCVCVRSVRTAFYIHCYDERYVCRLCRLQLIHCLPYGMCARYADRSSYTACLTVCVHVLQVCSLGAKCGHKRVEAAASVSAAPAAACAGGC